MVLSLLQSDLESFAGSDDVGMAQASVLEDFVQLGVFVIRIMVKECDTPGAGLNAVIDGLFPATMTPAGVLGQFFRRVLRIGDIEIGVLGERLDVVIAPSDAMFDVGAIGDDFPRLHDSIAGAPL